MAKTYKTTIKEAAIFAVRYIDASGERSCYIELEGLIPDSYRDTFAAALPGAEILDWQLIGTVHKQVVVK
jgi:hypothetical protein